MCIGVHIWGETPTKTELSSGGRAPCSTGSPTRRVFWNPSVSVDQLVLWEAAFGFSEVIYKRTHCTEYSAIFDQKQRDPVPHSPHLPDLTVSDCFCLFPWIKKSPQRETFYRCGRDETNKQTKMSEALKGIKIDEFKNCFEQWKKVSTGILHQMESPLKLTNV